MGMSDTCYEALNDLSCDVMHYSYLGYDKNDLSLIIDAMYSLTRFAVLSDKFVRPSEGYLRQAENRIVVGSLIEKIKDSDEEDACAYIANIAKRNTRLGDGLASVAKNVYDKRSLYDVIAEPLMYERLQKITRYNSEK